MRTAERAIFTGRGLEAWVDNKGNRSRERQGDAKECNSLRTAC